MVDKPGCTTAAQLAELRRVQAETGRISRSAIPSTTCSPPPSPPARLVKPRRDRPRAPDHRPRAAPGRQLHPARLVLGAASAAAAILVDIASHQFEQFLPSPARRGRSRSRARSRPTSTIPTRPLERLRPRCCSPPTTPPASSASTGSRRTARRSGATAGSSSWAPRARSSSASTSTSQGRPGGDHLFLDDGKGTRHMDCSDTQLAYGEQLRDDVLNRTETAMPQDHCFLAMELALAGAPAHRRRPLAGSRGMTRAQGRRRRRRHRRLAHRGLRARCPSSTRSRRSATSTPRAAQRSPAKFAIPATVDRPRRAPRARPRHRRHLHALRPAPRAGDRRRSRAGFHVVVEKPVAQQPRRGRRARRRRGGSPAGASRPIFQYRFGHGIQKLAPPARQGLRRPRLGRHRRDPLAPRRRLLRPAAWRGTFDGELGGCLTTHAIHIHDMLCEVLGPIASVHARTSNRAEPQRDRGHAPSSRSNSPTAPSPPPRSRSARARRLSRLRFCFDDLVAESDLAPTTPATTPGRFLARRPGRPPRASTRRWPTSRRCPSASPASSTASTRR